MTSRKLQALDFIKRYFVQWGFSPTLGEIAAALDVSAKRAHDLVHQLAVDQMIDVVAGKTRGIRLLEPALELSEADVLLLLAARGWKIVDGSILHAPGRDEAVDLPEALLKALTEKGLPGVPHLGHDAPIDKAVGIDDQDKQSHEGAQGA